MGEAGHCSIACQMGVWPNGGPRKSRKAKNRAWSNILPSSKGPDCRSYADFTRSMLGYTTKNPEFPDPPSMIEIVSLPPLTKEAIFHDSSVFTLYNSSTHSDPTCNWVPFKALLEADLSRHSIHRYTFQWDAFNGEDSEWNQIMIYFTVKHWKFAKNASAFDGYGLDLDQDKEIIQIGIVTRWLCGKIEQIKNGFNEDSKVRQRYRTRKKRELWEYRRETLTRHLPEYLDLLPNADCCSETEDNPQVAVQRSIRPYWRSEKYGNWIHEIDGLSYDHQASVMRRLHAARRFDTHRQEGSTINPLSKVCAGLPEDCYDSTFLTQHNELARHSLRIISNVNHLDNALTAIAARRI
ncbi:uncharacterized protein MELLADRAFT_85849 [Melampsora larici-populina 98AG31]|uniref:Uncharacterized protein n=1 Tax=Melampsora larici-populina (strain 98AG31 / pathotype 3-4-7) TaxID=747676 RepID=F4SDC8_MELLP|nr:uncharacterized protein MELLADRAFT_85849 [Melampsora larici-populina 98AG31]EGF97348.1 hypothetical protein MELLADRAFT_85849 [Melampsora larici-populina 98AG31]